MSDVRYFHYRYHILQDGTLLMVMDLSGDKNHIGMKFSAFKNDVGKPEPYTYLGSADDYDECISVANEELENGGASLHIDD